MFLGNMMPIVRMTAPGERLGMDVRMVAKLGDGVLYFFHRERFYVRLTIDDTGNRSPGHAASPGYVFDCGIFRRLILLNPVPLHQPRGNDVAVKGKCRLFGRLGKGPVRIALKMTQKKIFNSDFSPRHSRLECGAVPSIGW